MERNDELDRVRKLLREEKQKNLEIEKQWRAQLESERQDADIKQDGLVSMSAVFHRRTNDLLLYSVLYERVPAENMLGFFRKGLGRIGKRNSFNNSRNLKRYNYILLF